MTNPFRKAWDAFWGAENEPIRVKRIKREMLFMLLRYSQVGIRAIVTVHMILLALWPLGAIVPGFAFYDAPSGSGSFNAISHVGFWLTLEIVVFFAGAISLSFEVNNTVIEADDPKTLRQISSTKGWLILWIVKLVLGIAGHITHIVASAFELSDCSSTLCMNYSGFLIGFIVLISIILVLEVVAIYYACIYKRHLRWLEIFIKQRKKV